MKRLLLLMVLGIGLSSPLLLAQYTGGSGSGYSSDSSLTGWASTATSLLTASPSSMVANGITTSTITVQVKDADGNNLTTGGDVVELFTTLGTRYSNRQRKRDLHRHPYFWFCIRHSNHYRKS